MNMWSCLDNEVEINPGKAFVQDTILLPTHEVNATFLVLVCDQLYHPATHCLRSPSYYQLSCLFFFSLF